MHDLFMQCRSCNQQCCTGTPFMNSVNLSCLEFMDLYALKPFPFTARGFDIDMALPCVFFDAKHHKCAVYDHRPTACRMFPFVVQTLPESIRFFISPACAHTDALLSAPPEQIQALDTEFQRAYTLYIDYLNRLSLFLDLISQQDKDMIERTNLAQDLEQSVPSEDAPRALLAQEISIEQIREDMTRRADQLIGLHPTILHGYKAFKQFKRDHRSA